MKKILMLALAGFLSNAAGAQTQIDPTQQINWPLITGAGAPSLTCSSANYGQPCQDTAVTPNTFYTCGTDGWVVRGGSGSMVYPGAGVANSSGTAWNTSYGTGNLIPGNFLSLFGASGTSHAIGAVPDPGNVAGTTRFLREDQTWAVPSGGSLLLNPTASQTINEPSGTNTTITQTATGNIRSVQPLTATMNAVGPGYDSGNSGTSAQGWSTQGLFAKNGYSSTRGIFHGDTGLFDHDAIGDFAAHYDYSEPFGGVVASSDEGSVDWSIQLYQAPYFSGPVANGTNGLLSIVGALSPGTTYFNGNNYARFSASGNLNSVSIGFSTAPTSSTITVAISTNITSPLNIISTFTITGVTATTGVQTFVSGTNFTPINVVVGDYVGFYVASGPSLAYNSSGGGCSFSGAPSVGSVACSTTPGYGISMSTTVQNASTGASAITVNGLVCKGQCTNPRLANNFADGGILLDTTKGGATATLGTYSIIMNSESNSLSAGTVAVSTAWGNIIPSSCTNNPNGGQYQIPEPITCNVTLGTSPASPGNFVVSGPATSCSAVTAGTSLDIGLSGQFAEESYVIAVGTPSAGVQSITFCSRYAYDNSGGNTNAAAVFQGGPVGQAFVATSTVSSWPVAYFVIGATTSTQVMFAECIVGACNGVGGPGNVLHNGTPVTFYPMAWITGTANGNQGTAQLATNTVPFTTSDNIVGAPAAEYQAQGINLICGVYTPVGDGFNDCMAITDRGPVPQNNDLFISNTSSSSSPAPFAINLAPYSTGLGYWQTYINMGNRPTQTILHTYGGGVTTGYGIFHDDATTGGIVGQFNYTPSTGHFSMTTGVDSPLFNGVPLSTAGPSTNCLSESGTYVACGTVTAVSVATANGVSGTSSGGTTPALTLALGAITPSSVAINGGTAITSQTGTGSTAVMSVSPTLTGTPTAPTAASGTNTTQLATTAFVQSTISVTKYFSNAVWSIQPALFSTATIVGPVYFTNYSDTSSYPQVTVRQEGAISCTAAPTVQLMDLGTTASTVYASATAIVTLALGTTDGVFTGVGSSASLTAGHYYGIAFSTGTCTTPPTIDVTVYDTW